ncbi:P-loop containing nucleoside triphosphate hydrolase protein [Suillus paluster]|uniref:P-loop containing nucleoside triphosphate hydrolase protein n=1 Tax=Suillus paluster TaxID=48578 RepID=UPI001B86B77C|nr:P-loop containing nucleoside triphosphate hydrolase protein [Suillus paluster]KAG1741411.1 P-loop containing nucleoside triphosphate hydrolase protein [Suillus paluster]
MATSSDKQKNIVLFGQSGAGKSSLINLMAGEHVAVTSPDMRRCTMRSESYNVEFGGESYKVFDTIGLEEPQMGLPQYLEAVENAYKLIQDLERQGGIDLLLFCMRAGRVTATLQSNYRLFYEFLCEKKVPIVIAITHLEQEATQDSAMDDWWKRNEEVFHQHQIHVAGHACVTTVDRRGSYTRLYKESRDTIHDVIKKFTANGQKEAWIGGNNLFVSLMRKLKELLVGNLRPRKDIVPRLTKRCGISREVATKLADMIKKEST